mmetsp:Transcript_6149/g.9274  ORF Transcript_6149/g.9274 Transcript_6149/m.9274 type:complete len:717 (-) Transcript_6149:151-2301(-)
MIGLDDSLRWDGMSSNSDSDLSDFDVDAIDRELRGETEDFSEKSLDASNPLNSNFMESTEIKDDDYEPDEADWDPSMEIRDFDADVDDAMREWRERTSSIDEDSSKGSKRLTKMTPERRFATRSAEDGFSKARSLPESDINRIMMNNRTVTDSPKSTHGQGKKRTQKQHNLSHSVSVPVPTMQPRLGTGDSDQNSLSSRKSNSHGKQSRIGVQPNSGVCNSHDMISAVEYLNREDTNTSSATGTSVSRSRGQVVPLNIEDSSASDKIAETRSPSVDLNNAAASSSTARIPVSLSTNQRRPSLPAPLLNTGSNLWKQLSYRNKPKLAKFTEVHSFANAIKVVPCKDNETGMVLCATADSTVRLIDVSTGKVTGMYEGHSDRVLALAVNEAIVDDSGEEIPRMVVAGSRDETVCVWNYKTRRCIHVFSKHEGAVWAVAIYARPPQPLVFSGSSDCSIRSWDIHTGEELNVFRGHTDTVLCLAIHFGSGDHSTDPPRLVSGGADNMVRIWDPYSGRHCRMFEGHTDDVNAVSVVSDTSGKVFRGPKIVSGGRDRTVRVWDMLKGAPLAEFRGHSDCVYAVVGVIGNFTGGNMTTDSGSKGIETGVGKLNRQSSVWAKTLHDTNDNTTAKISFIVVSCGEDRTVRLWNVLEEKQIGLSRLHRGSVKGVSVAPIRLPGSDTSLPPVPLMLMATCSWDKTVIFYDFANVIGKSTSDICCVVS